MLDWDTYDKADLMLLKAEALCAELIDNGLSFEKLIYSPSGAFKKSFRADIDLPSGKYLEADTVDITVNRDGLYDRLPEGLFHQTRGNSKTAQLSEMVSEYRRFRDEERHARKFFQPLEQEFFRYSVMVEQEERNLTRQTLSANLEQLFYQFWEIGADLPAAPASVLVRIMPWLSRIKGDMHLTAKALALMLGKPVSAATHHAYEQYGADEPQNLRGMLLGVDSVTGTDFSCPTLTWAFTISDINTEEIAQYPDGQPYGRFLKRFEDIFIPLEIDISFSYECIQTEEETEKVLGYSLTI